MKKKFVLMTSALMAIGLLSACNQHQHSFKEVAEVPATCTESGVKAYYTCEGCDKIFDADKKETTLDALKIAALGHDYQFNSFVWEGFSAQAKYVCSRDANHVEMHDAIVTDEVTTPAGCESKGVRTYTATYDGHTDTKTAEVEAVGHKLVSHVAKADTCTEAGNSAYWSCENCDKYFSDENGEHEIAADSWVIAAHAHTMTHHDAVAESCETNGNKEYWTCSECNQYFLDEAGTQVSSAEGIVIAAHHTLTHHNKQPETCTSNGMIEYWSCSVCDKDFFDVDATREIEDEDAYIIPAHHVLTHHDAKEETCTENGNVEYWHCTVCEKNFADEEGITELNNVVISAKGHNMEHHDAKDPECEVDGNAEHWHCLNCEKNFADEEGTTELNNVVIPAKGHTWGTPSYEWSDNYTVCTATIPCEECDEKIVEKVKASFVFTTIPTTSSLGAGHYKASFENESLEEQSSDVEFIVPCATYDSFYKTYSIKSQPSSVKSSLVGNLAIPAEIDGKPVSGIGDYSLNDLSGITSINIGENVTIIDEKAFEDDVNVTAIIIDKDSKLETIGAAAFRHCDNLESLELPETVTKIGNDTFYGCGKLKDKTLDFRGTMDQWKAIEKGNSWHGYAINYIRCSDGTIER